jgi:hypothetical protein
MTKKEAQKLVPRGEISWLMNRLHVSSSHREIIKELFTRMTKYKGREFRNFRHACYRYAFKEMKANVDLVTRFRL